MQLCVKYEHRSYLVFIECRYPCSSVSGMNIGPTLCSLNASTHAALCQIWTLVLPCVWIHLPLFHLNPIVPTQSLTSWLHPCATVAVICILTPTEEKNPVGDSSLYNISLSFPILHCFSRDNQRAHCSKNMCLLRHLHNFNLQFQKSWVIQSLSIYGEANSYFDPLLHVIGDKGAWEFIQH